jgi:nitroreductase
MDAIEMIKERRSIRNFKDQKVDRSILNNILSTTTYAPSWANFQIVRYTVIDNKKMLNKLADEGLMGFKANIKTLTNAAGAIVVSNIKGKSGCMPIGNYVTSKGNTWEMFDAGIACQTLCLAAYAQGIGTVIIGILDDDKIAKVIDLPEDETVAAVIAYGYETEHPKATKRMTVEEIVRYK